MMLKLLFCRVSLPSWLAAQQISIWPNAPWSVDIATSHAGVSLSQPGCAISSNVTERRKAGNAALSCLFN
jgi:hypothetical protein